MSDQNERQIAAFSDLVEAHRGRVFGYIYSMLHNMSDAEDVYQQTTVLMWEKFAEFTPGSNFNSWALKVAYFNVKNFQRKQSRSRLFFSESVMEKVADSYQVVEQTDCSEALGVCLQRLSQKNRKLLQHRYAENTTLKRIAEMEGKSEAAVSMVLARLRKSLLRCIQSQLATRG